MNTVNQPENTTKTEVRDAAVQIGDEDKGLLIKEMFHVEQKKEEKSKGRLLREGLERQIRSECPNSSDESITLQCYGVLSGLCEMLTSSMKSQREYAKSEIRRFVKLGKGE